MVWHEADQVKDGLSRIDYSSVTNDSAEVGRLEFDGAVLKAECSFLSDAGVVRLVRARS